MDKKKNYNENWITGRYVGVADCLPTDTTQTASGGVISRSGAVTREGQMWEKYDESGGKWKLRNLRTKMCLALYPTKGSNNDDGTVTKGEIVDEKHIIVGLAKCTASNVFRWSDHEDGKVAKGDEAEVQPGMTLQQQYQYKLLPKAKQEAIDNDQITVFNTEAGQQRCYDAPVTGNSARGGSTTRECETKVATLASTNFLFWFNQGDHVYSSANSDKCTKGTVTSCSKTNFNCVVQFGGQSKTIELSTMSPADAIWPRTAHRVVTGGEN